MAPHTIFLRIFLVWISLSSLVYSLEIIDLPSEVDTGRSYRITYSPGGDIPTTFILRKGPYSNLVDVATLTESATDGEFTWTVDSSLESGDDYVLQTIQSNTISFSSPFTITKIDVRPTPSPSPSPAPAATSGAADSENDKVGGSRGLSTGAKAGIGVGAVVAVLVIGFGAFFLGISVRRKNPAIPADPERKTGQYVEKPELGGTEIRELKGQSSQTQLPFQPEMSGEPARAEMGSYTGHPIPTELAGLNHYPCEVDGQHPTNTSRSPTYEDPQLTKDPWAPTQPDGQSNRHGM